MCEWKPFVDAPKDGREILAIGVLCGDYGYTRDETRKFTMLWDEGHWRVQQALPNYSRSFIPQFYLNIPNDPAIKS